MIKTMARAAALSLVLTPVAIGGTAVAAQAAVPSCVSKTTWSEGVWQWAKAYNGCSTAQTFYFRWDRAVDGGCNTVAPRGSRSEGRLYQARFAGLSSC